MMQYSIVTLNKIKKDSNCMRFDAEYFKKEYLETETFLRKKVHKDLKRHGIKIFHPKEIERNYVENNGIIFLRAQNVRPFEINLESNKVFISFEDAKELSNNTISYEDVLITRTGANFGQCAVYLENEKSIASSHTFIVKSELTSPYFLTVFFNTKYGRKLLDKGMYGASQPEIAPDYIYRIPLPILSNDFINLVEGIYKLSHQKIILSRQTYTEAEQLLLSELGLLDWKPKQQLWFSKNYSDTQSADRIDAEYFQPMYEEVEDILAKKNQVSLDSLCSIINYGTVPTSPYCEDGTPYIKGLNLINGFIEGSFDKIENTQKLPKKFYVKENDIIISQMGTVGKAGIVTQKEEGYIFASFTIRIRLRDYEFIDPYVLTLYINNVAKEWYILRKIAQASVRQNTDLPTIRNLMVPEINKQVQKQIKDMILESQKSKLNSINFLEIAKRAVEIAIEQDEFQAETWINQELSSL